MSALKRLSSSYSRYLPLAEEASAFLNGSPDPFHAVANSVATLKAAGFQEVSDGSLDDKIQPGGKYFYTVHHSTLVAFTAGKKFVPGEGGFHILAGHTDSPNLAVKPRSKKPAKGGCIQLGVACYGGGLWHTWFDRDLGISGKVLVRGSDGNFEHRLLNISEPVARVSNLAIHLTSGEERTAFKVNKEDHTSPIIATQATAQKALEEASSVQLNKTADDKSWNSQQEPLLMEVIATQLGIKLEDIADFQLNLYDTQPAGLGGFCKEFLHSARLDNLATVFTITKALVEHSNEHIDEDQDIKVIVAFDHEEVGSVSSIGAGSPVMEEAIRRISSALNGASSKNPDYLKADTIRQSFCFSVDQAHAIHPNYSSKHEAQHAPYLNGGIVVKSNHNQRYATNGDTGFITRELARMKDIPLQEFAVRNDCPCGSTIGPTLSARTGIRVVDIGMPQLSMHSCRETMGIADLTNGLDLFKAFFRHFRELDKKMGTRCVIAN